MGKGKFNKKIILILALFFVGLILFDILTKDNVSGSQEAKYIKSLNLNIKGIVSEIIELDYGHDCGIVKLDIKESSISELDERNREKFFCLLKEDTGYIVSSSVSDFERLDSIVIKSNFYSVFRKNKSIINGKEIVLPNDYLFNPYNEINQILNDLE